MRAPTKFSINDLRYSIAKAVETERLRFEGNLDKWMKLIGAGITGYQPEAYAMMDHALEELVRLRAASPESHLEGVYVIPRELTDEEWGEVKYNVDRKASSDIPLWRIREAVKYADLIGGRRGQQMIQSPAPVTNVVGLLDWKDAALWHDYGLIVRTAQTPFGAYKILKGSQGRFEVYFGNAPFSGSMESDDEARTWAQEDYSRRVLSALVPAPVAEPVWRDGLGNVTPKPAHADAVLEDREP